MTSRNPAETARFMGPTILAYRNETEAGRRIAQPIIDLLAQSGLCRLFLEEEFGGAAAEPVDAFRAYESLAGFEASVAWTAWNNALFCCLSRFLARDVREMLFANSSALFAQSTRPMGVAVSATEGLRVSGQWSLVSGCELAEWMLLHCQVESQQTRYVLVHHADVEIVDTWYSGGLRGTGSHDVVAKDALVPAERSFSVAEANSPSGPAIARVPIIGHVTGAFSAQAIGVAQASIDFLLETALASEPVGPNPAMRERADIQLLIAQHSVAVDSARECLYQRVSDLWDRVVAGRTSSDKELARLYAASAHANAAARAAVDAMYELGGTRSVYANSPLERAHRDLHVMLRHVVAQPDVLRDAGRAQLGLAPSNPLYSF